MTWNSKSFCNWRIVRRVEIAENWIRNMWVQKNSKDNWNSVNSNIFTKFLNNSSKNIDINISLDREFDRLRRKWSSCRISRTECRTTRNEIRNDYSSYSLSDFFAKLFDLTMFDLKKTMKLVRLRDECWWHEHEIADRNQFERVVKSFLTHKKTNTTRCWWIKMKLRWNTHTMKKQKKVWWVNWRSRSM